ncbi:hypothetical protein ASD67_09070 [Sphingopyxis sp. Root1497]|uniref:hypothetical protein n=1 Tax=Sphingopyxis sp. Root1497 TaxID=1736474 RepID=UPI0006FAFF91|nr:hypothetical protein [Sphingopyxis sp. Root1497]KQZ64598.1 hypothetical protein ASD67_09070 [Sphingopyxis sp. Root1497]
MVNWVLRGAVLLWAVFFFMIGARGVIDPASYSETFGFTISGVAINTLRADLSSFFLVSAGSAALGVLMPGWVRALLVPAALYGTALTGRLIGVALGDPTNFGIVQGMIIEALSVLLMVGSWWVLSRPAPAPADPLG